MKTKKVWLLPKNHNQKFNNMIKKVRYPALQEVLKLLNQVQWPRSLSIKLKETMMMNGLLLLNLILNFLKSKSSLKEWENKSLKRKSKSSLINKCKKKEEKKKDRKNNNRNIINFKKNKQDFMMKERDKKKKSIKEKYNLKRKCAIVKLRINLKERKLKRKKKINLIIFLFKRSNKKSQFKNNKWEIENWKNLRDSNKLWRRMNKMKEDSDKKLKDKDLK